jgi:plastocyanin
MKSIGWLAAIALVAGLLVAVSLVDEGQRSGAGDRSATITLDDRRFVPNRLDATVGVPLVVRLTNEGVERHDLNFASLHMPGHEGVESILAPGETRTMTLTFDQAGTHTFICSLPGHAASGMSGVVFVRP